MARTVHVRINGNVQGVGFRDWTSRTAIQLGLTGWVRNRTDGWVEAMFHGAPETVEDMLERCRRGAPASDVSNVIILDEPSETFDVFEIRATR